MKKRRGGRLGCVKRLGRRRNEGRKWDVSDKQLKNRPRRRCRRGKVGHGGKANCAKTGYKLEPNTKHRTVNWHSGAYSEPEHTTSTGLQASTEAVTRSSSTIGLSSLPCPISSPIGLLFSPSFRAGCSEESALLPRPCVLKIRSLSSFITGGRVRGLISQPGLAVVSGCVHRLRHNAVGFTYLKATTETICVSPYLESLTLRARWPGSELSVFSTTTPTRRVTESWGGILTQLRPSGARSRSGHNVCWESWLCFASSRCFGGTMGLRETNWHHRAPHGSCEEGILAGLVLLQGESFLTEQKGCSPRWGTWDTHDWCSAFLACKANTARLLVAVHHPNSR